MPHLATIFSRLAHAPSQASPDDLNSQACHWPKKISDTFFGDTKPFPAGCLGGAVSPPAGAGAEPRRQNAFWQQSTENQVSGSASTKTFGNVQFNWPKLFQAFSVTLSLIFFHNCINSIIPHQYM